MQHHPLARLPLTLAPMRAAALHTLHQTRRMQLRLGPRVAPAELVVANALLVKVLHVPTAVVRPVQLQHAIDLAALNAPGRGLAQPAVDQTRFAVVLEPIPVAPKLALRHSQQFPGLRQLPPFPAAQNISKLQHSTVLATSSGSLMRLHPEAQNRTTRVLPNPNNSCAIDTSLRLAYRAGPASDILAMRSLGLGKRMHF